jgi:hypothetical protein
MGSHDLLTVQDQVAAAVPGTLLTGPATRQRRSAVRREVRRRCAIYELRKRTFVVLLEALKPGAEVKRFWLAMVVTGVVGLLGLLAMQLK